MFQMLKTNLLETLFIIEKGLSPRTHTYIYIYEYFIKQITNW